MQPLSRQKNIKNPNFIKGPLLTGSNASLTNEKNQHSFGGFQASKLHEYGISLRVISKKNFHIIIIKLRSVEEIKQIK